MRLHIFNDLQGLLGVSLVVRHLVAASKQCAGQHLKLVRSEEAHLVSLLSGEVTQERFARSHVDHLARGLILRRGDLFGTGSLFTAIYTVHRLKDIDQVLRVTRGSAQRVDNRHWNGIACLNTGRMPGGEASHY